MIRMYKKLSLILLLCAVCFLMCACGNKIKNTESVTIKDAESYQGFKLNATKLLKEVSFEQDGLLVVLSDIIYNDAETHLVFNIKNSTTQDLTVLTTDLAINGLMSTESMMVSVTKGASATGYIKIGNEWFAELFIDTIADLEFVIRALDERLDEVIKSDALHAPIDAPKNHIQKYFDEGFVIYQNDGITFLAKELKKSKLSNDTELSFYVENNSKKGFSVMAKKVFVNGKEIEPTFVVSVSPGKKAIDSMLFSESALKDANISEITSIKARFRAIDTSFETLFETQEVEIPVK